MTPLHGSNGLSRATPLKRRSPLLADPEKTRGWQDRSRQTTRPSRQTVSAAFIAQHECVGRVRRGDRTMKFFRRPKPPLCQLCGKPTYPDRSPMINSAHAVCWIKDAYDLGVKLDGPGRYDMTDPRQKQCRRIRDWITMAEHDALESRRGRA